MGIGNWWMRPSPHLMRGGYARPLPHWRMHSAFCTHKYRYIYTNTNTQIQIYKYTNTNTKIQTHKYKYTNTNTLVWLYRRWSLIGGIPTHNIKVSPKWLQILIVSANQSIVPEWWKILKGLWLQLVNKKSSSFFVRHKKNTRAGLGGGFLQSGLESSRIVNIMTKCEHWSPRLCSFLFVCFGAGSSWNHPKGKITGARTPIAKVWFETKEMIRTAFRAKNISKLIEFLSTRKHFKRRAIFCNLKSQPRVIELRFLQNHSSPASLANLRSSGVTSPKTISPA